MELPYRDLGDAPDLAALDTAACLLEEMLALAERAAEDTCGDPERAALQERLALLLNDLDRAVEQNNAEGTSNI